jgi:hypothetical protein
MNYLMKHSFVLIILLINFFVISPASASNVVPLNLQQLSSRATLIFYAEVISNTVKKDKQSGHIATFTEFKIIDLIKGNTSNTHLIKQIGGRLTSSGTTLRIHGVPKFDSGKKYVVFLPEKSSIGFSSPLGLHQGSFTVSTINGEQLVSNGHNLTEPPIQSSSIQIPLAVHADKPAHARLDDFINTVRAYNID